MIKIIKQINAGKILETYHKLENTIVWTQFGNAKQTGLQYILNEDPWTSAVGKSKGDDFSSSLLNPFFTGTIFEDIINEFSLKRSRLMWLGDKTCYSMHNDATARIHIPIITNDQCYFVFESGHVENLKFGFVYYVDTRCLHTAMNGSNLWRLHLVGCVE